MPGQDRPTSAGRGSPPPPRGAPVGALDLGPFRLTTPFARGASGEVWKGWHRDQRLPIALKVLTSQFARDDTYVRHFQNEVRAVAALDHPHIVTVLDVGTIDAEAESRSEGRLVAGSPWLAMEYASDGTVADRPPRTWAEIRAILLATLQSLAHAHARGVVHRDLKPANLLICGERDPRPGLKLSDFGIASRFGEEDVTRPGAGTPHYMAPEQLTGEAIGPWTDLYSLGVLGWRLTTGHLPFEGLKKLQLVRAHLSKDLPDFRPMSGVPAGVERWLRALLAKRPHERPQRAADAAAALVTLDPTEDEHARAWMGSLDVEGDTMELATDELESAETDSVWQTPALIGPPPHVPDWREAISVRPPALLGAGLGLFGLRDPPLVGRTSEQDVLWEELRAVHAHRQPRLVVLHGSAGVGKTRLGSWLCRRADEVGAARVLWSGGRSAEAGGLLHTIAQMLRCDGLEGAERDEHLVSLLRDRERAATARALLDGELPEGQRAEVAARLLCSGQMERPVVLCLDDAHRAEEDLDVCRAVLGLGRPALLVLLVEDEALAQRPRTRARLEDLPGRWIPVGPLPQAARQELMRGLLHLDDDLAIQVENRAEGNPMFAVQIVGEWVHHGWLIPAERGFVLRPDVRGAMILPDSLHAVWVGRLERLLEDQPASATWDLEVAAALGPEVDEALWHTACDDPDGRGVGWDHAGVARRVALRDRLLVSRMATPRPSGFQFLPQPRQSVVRLSQERGRWPKVCTSAASAVRQLARRPDSGSAGPARNVADRIARLLVEARQPGQALPWFLDAVEEIRHHSARRALGLLVEAEVAARRAGVSEDHPLAARSMVARARVHMAVGEPEEALRHAREAQRVALARAGTGLDDPWRRLAREALDAELSVHLARRDTRSARRTFEQLAPMVRATGDPEAMGSLLNAQAGLLVGDPGQRDVAEALLSEAAEWHRRGRVRPHATAALTLNRALLARESRRLERARALLESALDQLGAGAPRHTVGLTLAALAEVLLRTGEPVRAEQTAVRAATVFDSLGNPGIEARLVLGLALSANGRHESAASELGRARKASVDHGRAELAMATAVASAIVEARAGHWSVVHDRLREAERSPHARDAITQDLVDDLVTACEHGGFPQLRARAAALAG